MDKDKKSVVVSLSGGMDSATLLLKAVHEYAEVTAISFNYGQKHDIELTRAGELVEYLKSTGHKVIYHVVDFSSFAVLLGSSLVKGGQDVPEGHYEGSNMKETVVPNRNKIFSSFIQSAALTIANRTGNAVGIGLGIHAGDHEIYPDCRKEFRDADYQAFVLGNWNAGNVYYWTPFLEGNKATILAEGVKLCDALGIDFDEYYRRTNTSYKPYPSGNSDYKSASSVERIEAFMHIGRPDPVQYEDETGPVTYEKAKAHVEKVLAEGS